MPDVGIPATTAAAAHRQAWVLLTLCLGVLVAQVDTSVVNLAIQPIGAAFQASVAGLQWVLDGYNLSYAVLLLSGGLVADLYGRRLVFQAGAALLGLASLACALAPTIGVLVASRVAAGIGAALLLPSSLAIVRVAWPEPRARRHALGVWASCNGLAFAIGPTLGGLLIQHFGWQSVFVLAVPFALAASVLAGWVVPNSADPEGRALDLRGQVLGVAVLGGLVFAAIDGYQGGVAWIRSLSAACVAAPLFISVERRAAAAALVPLELFRQPAFSGAFAATAAMTFGIYGMIFLLPLLWQASGLLHPEGAGLALLPRALVFFLISPRSGHLTNRLGVRVMTAGGTAIVACGLLMLAMTHAGRPLAVAELGLGLTGIGMGLNTGPLMSVAVDSVHAARSGTASALINVARISGATLGVAVLGAAFTLAGSGATGFRAAMLTGAVVQFAGAWAVWKGCTAFSG
jgi:MFS transporter, DHA2 family, methylenomycin A resistance protein